MPLPLAAAPPSPPAGLLYTERIAGRYLWSYDAAREYWVMQTFSGNVTLPQWPVWEVDPANTVYPNALVSLDCTRSVNDVTRCLNISGARSEQDANKYV